jgi:hypothetical protein
VSLKAVSAGDIYLIQGVFTLAEEDIEFSKREKILRKLLSLQNSLDLVRFSIMEANAIRAFNLMVSQAPNRSLTNTTLVNQILP